MNNSAVARSINIVISILVAAGGFFAGFQMAEVPEYNPSIIVLNEPLILSKNDERFNLPKGTNVYLVKHEKGETCAYVYISLCNDYGSSPLEFEFGRPQIINGLKPKKNN